MLIELLQQMIENLLCQSAVDRLLEALVAKLFIVAITRFDQAVTVHQYPVIWGDCRVLQHFAGVAIDVDAQRGTYFS